jgi:hypothetical protein
VDQILEARPITLIPLPANAAGATKAQKSVLKEAFTLYGSRFSVPNESADQAWERATEWVSLVSGMRLDVATDKVLQTYRSPDISSMDLACQVNRSKGEDDTVITATCGVNNSFGGGTGKRGTAMLVGYVMTGDTACLNDGFGKVYAADCFLDCSAGTEKCVPLEPKLDFPEEHDSVNGSCSVEQITSMVKAGLTAEQIKAACGDDD